MRRRPVEQPSLFPTEDLIIPASINKIRKAVSAIHAVPLRAEHAHTLNTRRLFDACILVAQLDMRSRPRQELERIKTERISTMFETRVTDLARLAGIPGKNYQRLYEALDALFEMTLRWNIVAEDAEVVWDMRAHLMSSLGYGKGHKRGLIRFSIDPSILEIVLEPRNWATLSLQAQSWLGTPASYALYQSCWRYVNTSAKVTAALPTETWIELLVGPSRYVKTDPKTGERIVNYADFKRRCLLDAIARVNDIQVLTYTLELKEFKSGNRISKLQFRFLPKKQASLGLPVTWPQDMVDVLVTLGYSEAEINDISQGHSLEEVAESIVRLNTAERRLKALGRRISSRKAYFNGILTNVALGADDSDLDAERIESQVRAQEEERQAQQRQERLRQAFALHQAQAFALNLFEIDEPARNALLQAFEASEEGTKSRLLWEKGWSEKNVGALSVLRTWLAKVQPVQHDALLPRPQDRSFEGWMGWRLEQEEAR